MSVARFCGADQRAELRRSLEFAPEPTGPAHVGFSLIADKVSGRQLGLLGVDWTNRPVELTSAMRIWLPCVAQPGAADRNLPSAVTANACLVTSADCCDGNPRRRKRR